MIRLSDLTDPAYRLRRAQIHTQILRTEGNRTRVSILLTKGTKEIKAIYQSIEGERLVLERYRAFVERWAVPNQQVRMPTSQGPPAITATDHKLARIAFHLLTTKEARERIHAMRRRSSKTG